MFSESASAVRRRLDLERPEHATLVKREVQAA